MTEYDYNAIADALIGAGIDITTSHDDWHRLACACVTVADGRQLFHRLSSLHPKYNERETEYMYARAEQHPTSIGYLINVAKKYIDITPYRSKDRAYSSPAPPKPRYSPPKPAKQPAPTPLHPIPWERVTDAYLRPNALIDWLMDVVQDDDRLGRVLSDYAVGGTPDGRTIFWRMGVKGRKIEVFEGKKMRYGADGHKRKDGFGSVAAEMRAAGQLPAGYTPPMILFGLHLAAKSAKVVCVAESEKTAILGAIAFPTRIWMATGGEANLTVNILRPLADAGKVVILFPDTDPRMETVTAADAATPDFRGYPVGTQVSRTFHRWASVAAQARREIGLKVQISRLLEDTCTDEQRAAKWDVGDYILATTFAPKQPAEAEVECSWGDSEIDRMVTINPNLGELIRRFALTKA